MQSTLIFNIELMHESNDPALMLKLYLTCLKNVMHKQQGNAVEKQKIQKIVKKYSQQSADIKSFIKDIKVLNQKNYLMFKMLHDGYVGFRDGYYDLLRGQFSKDLDEKIDICELLLRVIPKINLIEDNLTYKDVITKFNVPLLGQIKKNIPKQPPNFSKRWREKASEKLESKALKKATPSSAPDKETPPSIQNPPKKVQPPKKQESEDSSVEAPKQKPSRVADKAEIQRSNREKQKMEKEQRDRERQEERVRRARRQEEQRRRENQKNLRDQLQKKADSRQYQKTIKGKASAIQSYIDSRKDLFCQRSKLKQLSEHLAYRVDEFLKNAMEEMYNSACLRNKKNVRLGNQLGYLSEESNRIVHNQQFYFHPNTKIYNLTFKHKHTLYNTLRTNEVKKQDEMRSNLEAKTAEGDKKIDKKIENYILKPRPKESDTVFIQYREEKDGFRSDSVTIGIEHVIHFLENHPWLNNSLLLFDVYHRF